MLVRCVESCGLGNLHGSSLRLIPTSVHLPSPVLVSQQHETTQLLAPLAQDSWGEERDTTEERLDHAIEPHLYINALQTCKKQGDKTGMTTVDRPNNEFFSFFIER